MNGKEVFRFATATIVQCIEDVIEKNRVQKEEIDYVVCHQANKRIIDYAQKKSKISSEKSCVKISSKPLVLAIVYSFARTPANK